VYKERKVSIIAAIDNNGYIGNKGKLPWPPIKGDMEFFRNKTRHHVVVMGRKTWESIPEQFKPLKNRINIIISSTPENYRGDMFNIDRGNTITIWANSLKNALSAADGILANDINSGWNQEEIFIIGGSQVYQECLNNRQNDLVDNIYLTVISGNYEGDTKFPMFSNLHYSVKVEGSGTESDGRKFTIYRYTRR